MAHEFKIILQSDGRACLWAHERFLLFFHRWVYRGEFKSIADALEEVYGPD